MNHFGKWSETTCNFDYSGHKPIIHIPTRLKQVFLTLGYTLLVIVALPFFLVFFPLVMTPYLLVSFGHAACAKVCLSFVGVILGLLMLPLFIPLALLYIVLYGFYFIAFSAIEQYCSFCGCGMFGTSNQTHF